jgi:uncharacterized membrane protein YphA (DoxX/SURF4 family)
LGIAKSLDFGSPHGIPKYTLSAMQKLFSMFPSGSPGLALLLLRLFVGAVLLSDALTTVSAFSGFSVCVLVGCALALIVGYLTPIAAVLASVTEAAIGPITHLGNLTLHSLAPMVIGIALALLGPGAYSLDARIFGRRLVEFGPDIDEENR